MDRYDAADEMADARECIERVLRHSDGIPRWLMDRSRSHLMRLHSELEVAEMAFALDRPSGDEIS